MSIQNLTLNLSKCFCWFNFRDEIYWWKFGKEINFLKLLKKMKVNRSEYKRMKNKKLSTRNFIKPNVLSKILKLKIQSSTSAQFQYLYLMKAMQKKCNFDVNSKYKKFTQS